MHIHLVTYVLSFHRKTCIYIFGGYTSLFITCVIWSPCEHGMCPLGSQSQFVNINCPECEKKLPWEGSVQKSPALLKASIYITSFSHTLTELLECREWKMEALLLDRLVSREFCNILLFRHSLNDWFTLAIVESTEKMGKGLVPFYTLKRFPSLKWQLKWRIS